MDQLSFNEILRKYLSGEASAEERKFIDAWYERMGKDAAFPLDERWEIVSGKRSWNEVNAHIQFLKRRRRARTLRWYVTGAVAAMLIVIISSGTFTRVTQSVVSKPRYSSTHDGFKKIVNDHSAAERVTLPDGSHLTLEPETEIQYSSAFDGPERRVYLDGKAFFEVAPDKMRPFKVYTQQVITKVLGTSFTVDAFRHDKQVRVSVNSGSVSVYATGDNSSATGSPTVILTPNQSFVFNKAQNKGSRSIVEEPKVLLPEEDVKRMRFEDVAPKILFAAIEKVYGVEVIFDEKKFATCRLTTNISDGNIFRRLDIICEVMNATYKVRDGKIVIEGEGCHPTP